MDDNRRHIRSYKKVWDIENRIYAIQNIVLPVPINPREILYFFVIFLVVLVLSAILPFLKYVPAIIRSGVFPFAMSQFLLKMKLDGKPPQKYAISWVKYAFKKGEYIERFKGQPKTPDNKIKIQWTCSRK